MKKFTKEQLENISKLKVQLSHDTSGYDYDLHWGINDEGIYAYYFFQSRDCDGDWGTSCTWHENISFKELIETIKTPLHKFDVRSWN